MAMTAMTRATTGVVLAGGLSRRMGQSKAGLSIAGEPLLRRVADRLREALGNVVVVGPEDLVGLAPEGIRVLRDAPEHAGEGPLAGLVAALEAIETPLAFVVACDMPFIAADVVRAMVALAAGEPEAEAVVPRTSRGLEPLHAVYRRTCVEAARRQLEVGERALRRLLPRLRVREVAEEELRRLDPEGWSTFNANTPEEWERALAHAAREMEEGSVE